MMEWLLDDGEDWTADELFQRRIRQITLDEGTIISLSPEIAQERAVAIADLLEDNRFYPCEDASPAAHTLRAPAFAGPYDLAIQVRDGKIYLHIKADSRPEGMEVMLAAKPFRSIIKDYFMICESYTDAIQCGNHQQVEAIDMGRRAIHNEGSELLKELLRPRVELNFETARRLFTLVCVLHLHVRAM
jgi:uncharacterized protein (UPF0262 family)